MSSEALSELTRVGDELGIDPEEVAKIVENVKRKPGVENVVEAAKRKLVEAGLGLPEGAAEAGLSAEEMVDFASDVLVIGGADHLGNPDVWDKVKSGGAGAGLIDVHQDLFQLPDEAYKGGDITNVLEGQAEAGALGADANDPDYWKDYAKVQDGSMKAEDFVDQYAGLINPPGNTPGGGSQAPGSKTPETPVDEPAPSDPPAPGGQPDQPGPGNQSDQPGPGNQSDQPGPGSKPDQPAPGSQPDQPGPGGQPDQPPSESQTEQPAPEPQPEDPVPDPAPQPEQPAPGTGPGESEIPHFNPEDSAEPTPISRELLRGNPFSEWYEVTYSDGSTRYVHYNPQTGEVVETIRPKGTATGGEMTTSLDEEESDADGETSTESEEGESEADSDDAQSDETEESETSSEDADDDSESDSEDSDSSSEDSESESDDSESADSETESSDEAEADGEDAGESTPVDPFQPTEEQMKAMREALIANPVFQETVIGVITHDNEKGSGNSTPDPMAEGYVPVGDIDPEKVKLDVTGQPVEPATPTLELTEEMKEAIKRSTPGSGAIDYGPDHFGGSEQQSQMNPGMQDKTGRGTMDGEAAPPPPSNQDDDEDDEDENEE